MAFSNSPDNRFREETFWTGGRILMSAVAAGLLVSAGLSGCKSTEVANNSPAVNRAAPATAPAARVIPAGPVAVPAGVLDSTVKTLDGGSLKLSDYQDKVLVVNIWATWCGPCRMEMPELVKMNNDYKSRGLVVLGLATTYNEQNDPQRVKDFVKAQNIPYKIIWDDGTLATPLLQAVNARSVIPQSFVISRDGRIVKHFSGFSINSTPTLMRQAIEDALNEKAKA